ncbi:TadE/TadG family type IV pilus assembly protein [Georgenia subflava]|uniref:Pilus assembly protein n=1 Tax=Georgenia subflava TaxID=1622177 RepID=A0A6N7EIH1_9MICO|nr:pilus assembly protein TadG-related protein [Georgenia subflava]MPV35956.1 pilus assembly protein [Georgenia subflava]
MRRPLRLLAHHNVESERGSVSIWLALSTFVMIVLVGLVADLGGQLHVQQRARDIATQAARAGGDRISGSDAVQGRRVTVDVAHARSAARDYLAAAGVDGTVTIENGTTVSVAVHDTYDTAFLSVIGIDGLDVTGTASARVVRTLGGIER